MKKARLQVRLGEKAETLLSRAAERPGVTKASIVEAAIVELLNPKEDSQEYAKTHPNFSGIPPATKTWAWGNLKELAKNDFYAGQIEERIEDLDKKAADIRRTQMVNNQTWEEEIGKAEMESERLKEILLNAKKNLQPQ